MNRGTSRRKFIQVSGTIAGGMMLPSILGSPVFGQNSIDQSDIISLFKSNHKDASILTGQIFRKCILERIMPPTPPLKHNWVYPGGPYYKGQWIWDTMFVVDLLSILPGKEQVIRDIFQNYWDFQDRWNPKMPEYAHDMVTVAIKTAPQEVRQFSQIPILAWGVERVFQRNGDRELLRQCLPRLEKFHNTQGREGRGLVWRYLGNRQHSLPDHG